MTKERAIERLRWMYENCEVDRDICDAGCNFCYDARNMAIKALKEPSGDCISRADTLETLSAMISVDNDNAKVYSKVYSQIKDQPCLKPGRETGGTWGEKNSHTYICDKCGFEQAIYDNLSEYRFCPRCGTKMEWVDRGYIPIELAEIGKW